MTSAKQAAANRRNALKSTGPNSDAGKMRSSRNSLKHGLSAQQVVLWDEDPAAFEALREELYAYYQPANPVAVHLVEHVAACIHRSRRVPEIEAAIYSHFYLRCESDVAFGHPDYAYLGSDSFLPADYGDPEEEANVAAKRNLKGRLPVKGAVFEKAERSLNSLVHIASAIEGSMYRAIRELERMRAERPEPMADRPVSDVEADETNQLQRARPRLSKRPEPLVSRPVSDVKANEGNQLQRPRLERPRLVKR